MGIRKETDDQDFEEAITRIQNIRKSKDKKGTLVLVIDQDGWMDIGNIDAHDFQDFLHIYLQLVKEATYN